MNNTVFDCLVLKNIKDKDLDNVFPVVAAKREKQLYYLTHKKMVLLNVKNNSTITEDSFFMDVLKTKDYKGNKLYIIKGETGTGKSELCMGLKYYLEEKDQVFLYFYKDMTYKDIFNEVLIKYKELFNKAYKYESNIKELLSVLMNPKNNIEEEKINNLINLIFHNIYKRALENNKSLTNSQQNRIKELIKNGLERFYNPPLNNDSMMFFTEKEFYNEKRLLEYFFGDINSANDLVYNELKNYYDTPSLKDIFQEFSSSINKRLYIIFEDFSLNNVEANELLKIMLSDNIDYNITFILAGTPGNINRLKDESTLKDRAFIFRTDQGDIGEDYKVELFNSIKPIDFINPYLKYLKSQSNLYLIVKDTDEKYKFKYNLTNNQYCSKCNKYLRNYCKISEKRCVLYPFNEMFINNVFDSLKDNEQNPRIIMMKIKEFLRDFIFNNKLPFDNYEILSELDYTKNYNFNESYTSEENNFLKWYGFDEHLFKLFFNKELEVNNNINDEENRIEYILEDDNDNTSYAQVTQSEKQDIRSIIREDYNYNKLINNLSKFYAGNWENDPILSQIIDNIKKYINEKINEIKFSQNKLIIIKNLFYLKYESTPIFDIEYEEPYNAKNLPQFYLNVIDWDEVYLNYMITYVYIKEHYNNYLKEFIHQNQQKEARLRFLILYNFNTCLPKEEILNKILPKNFWSVIIETALFIQLIYDPLIDLNSLNDQNLLYLLYNSFQKKIPLDSIKNIGTTSKELEILQAVINNTKIIRELLKYLLNNKHIILQNNYYLKYLFEDYKDSAFYKFKKNDIDDIKAYLILSNNTMLKDLWYSFYNFKKLINYFYESNFLEFLGEDGSIIRCTIDNKNNTSNYNTLIILIKNLKSLEKILSLLNEIIKYYDTWGELKQEQIKDYSFLVIIRNLIKSSKFKNLIEKVEFFKKNIYDTEYENLYQNTLYIFQTMVLLKKIFEMDEFEKFKGFYKRFLKTKIKRTITDNQKIKEMIQKIRKLINIKENERETEITISKIPRNTSKQMIESKNHNLLELLQQYYLKIKDLNFSNLILKNLNQIETYLNYYELLKRIKSRELIFNGFKYELSKDSIEYFNEDMFYKKINKYLIIIETLEKDNIKDLEEKININIIEPLDNIKNTFYKFTLEKLPKLSLMNEIFKLNLQKEINILTKSIKKIKNMQISKNQDYFINLSNEFNEFLEKFEILHKKIYEIIERDTKKSNDEEAIEIINRLIKKESISINELSQNLLNILKNLEFKNQLKIYLDI
ncbi:MAG: hypothetical protein ACTSVV_17910 [Promethearchaeota archaeon]